MTIVGAEALAHADDDANDGTVAIGYKAAYEKIGSGSQYTKASVHIGYASGAAQTTGAGNTSVGHATMGGNPTGTALTGSNNTVTGYSAGYWMSGDSHTNTLYGSLSGGHISTGASNTFIGYAAGANGESDDAASNTATDNVAIGFASMGNAYGAASAHFTATDNVAIGSNSMKNNSTGTNNVALGSGAAEALTTGTFNTLLGSNTDVNAATDSYQTSIGAYGIIKYKTARVTITKAHSGVNSIIAEVCQIRYFSIIHRVSCTVITKSNLGTYSLNLQLSTSSGTAADGALANASSTITNPEILGASSPSATSQNSTTALGTASDIIAGSGADNGTVYTCEPTTTIVGSNNTFLYICNAVDNGTSDSNDVVLEICVEYQSSHL